MKSGIKISQGFPQNLTLILKTHGSPRRLSSHLTERLHLGSDPSHTCLPTVPTWPLLFKPWTHPLGGGGGVLTHGLPLTMIPKPESSLGLDCIASSHRSPDVSKALPTQHGQSPVPPLVAESSSCPVSQEQTQPSTQKPKKPRSAFWLFPLISHQQFTTTLCLSILET